MTIQRKTWVKNFLGTEPILTVFAEVGSGRVLRIHDFTFHDALCDIASLGKSPDDVDWNGTARPQGHMKRTAWTTEADGPLVAEPGIAGLAGLGLLEVRPGSLRESANNYFQQEKGKQTWRFL